MRLGLSLAITQPRPAGGGAPVPPAFSPSLDFSDARNSMYL